MLIATVAFRRCIINAPEFGSDEDHIGSRVFFDLSVADEAYANLHVDIRQLVREGTEREALLVTHPAGYSGPFNFQVFQGLTEFYYRHAVGGKWGMFGMPGTGMRLENWAVEQEMLVQFEVFDNEEMIAGIS